MANTGQTRTVPISSMEQVVSLALEKAGGTLLRAAVIAPYETDLFVACKRAVDAGLITPIMIGDRLRITQADEAAGWDPGKVALVETETGAEAIQTAARMALAGEVDLILRGSGFVQDFVRPLIAEGSGFLSRGATAAHVAFIKPDRYERAFLLTDALVHSQPDLKQKVALIECLVRVGRGIGMPAPRVAVLAAVEVVYPQMPMTLEAAILSKMGERGQIKGASVDGPLSFDCAVDPFAAESKGIRNSEVAGRADALLAPNKETAYGIYKGMALYGRAQLGGILYGGRVPVAMPMVGDSADTVFHSIALACAVR